MEELEAAQKDYLELTSAAPAEVIDIWKVEILEAERRRHSDHTSMDVMANRIDKGQDGMSMLFNGSPYLPSAPSKLQIELMLAQEELRQGAGGESGWLSTGLNLEEAQCVVFVVWASRQPRELIFERFELRQHARKIGKGSTTQERLELTKRRQRLGTRISAFVQSGNKYLDERVADVMDDVIDILEDDLAGSDEEVVSENPPPTTSTPKLSRGDPENQTLPLPSAIPMEQRRQFPGLEKLLKKELDLRKGQANDALQKVRECLSHLAWQYKAQVRVAKSTKQTTKSWAGVTALGRELRLHRRIYNHSRHIMIQLASLQEVDNDFPFLTWEDCRASEVIINPNAKGMRNIGLVWFWGKADSAVGPDAYMQECGSCCLIIWISSQLH